MSAAARAQRQAPASRLTGSPGGRARTEVGPGDTVPAQRQADGLRADAARTVEHHREVLADQGVQRIPLPTDARLPVRAAGHAREPNPPA